MKPERQKPGPRLSNSKHSYFADGDAEMAKLSLQGKDRLIGLDLLRALAISGVLITHIGIYGLHFGTDWWLAGAGGYGVELFFALSGFLIGRLLLEIVERDPSIRAWGIFMIRRWMRTLPVYMLWILVLLVVAPPPNPAVTALKYTFLVQNFAWPMSSWFAVSWSLTVEEWFYLLFSALMIALTIRSRSVAVFGTCAVFLIVPLLLRLNINVPDAEWDSGMRKVMVFRLDAIAYGVVMAALYRQWPTVLHRWRYPALALELLLAAFPHLPIGYLLGSWWKATAFNFVSIGFALAMPWAVSLRLPFLAVRGLITWLAERSYCLYIVHLTFVILISNAVTAAKMPDALTALATMLLSALVAELSFRLFEMPILRRRPPQFVKAHDTQAEQSPRGWVGLKQRSDKRPEPIEVVAGRH